MIIKKDLWDAVATIKEHCHDKKCSRGEECEFHTTTSFGGCALAYAPLYWSVKKPKTRMEVFLEKFPDARRDPCGEPSTCVRNVFGETNVDCDNSVGCENCWNEPAPDEYQED